MLLKEIKHIYIDKMYGVDGMERPTENIREREEEQ